MTSSDPRARVAAWLIAGALSLASGAAYADAPTAADLESARALVKEGRALRASGDLRGALEKLKAGHALGQTPITALELARTYEMVGALVEAREVCLSVARMPVETDETERSVAARAESEKLAQSLRPRIPSLVVQVSGPPPSASPEVRIDGVLVPPAAFGEPLKANPKQHVVSVSVEGFETTRADVTLAEGETKALVIALTPVQATAPVPIEEPHPRRALVTAGIVIGVAGGVIGVTTGILALSQRSKLDDQCVNYKCGPGEPSDTLASGRQWGTVASIAFGVGLVGVGMIVVGLVTAPSSKTHAATPRGIAPWIGLGAAGVRGSF